MTNQLYVTFFLNEETYGVSSDYVQEVLRKPKQIMEYPNMPSHMIGTIMNRGNLIPVIDLKTRYSFHNSITSIEEKLIIVQCEKNAIAIMVDDVDDIVNLGNEAILPLNDIFRQSGIHAVQNIGKIEEKIICLIDVMDLIKDIVNEEKKEVI